MLDLPGRAEYMKALLWDYQNNPPRYPDWHRITVLYGVVAISSFERLTIAICSRRGGWSDEVVPLFDVLHEAGVGGLPAQEFLSDGA